jgi:hypothetical protein
MLGNGVGNGVGVSNVSSWTHLWIEFLAAADIFAKKSHEIEEAEATSKNRSTDILQLHSAYVSGAIFNSVSCLEAAINDVFARSADQHFQASIAAVLGSDVTIRLETAWPLVKEKMSILDKFTLFLELSDKPPFDRIKQPYHDVNLLIRLRNKLVHYHPEWDKSDVTSKLETNLNKRFSLNRFYENTDNAYFPDKCLGAGCALWAVASCKQFTQEFFSRTGLS